MTHVSSRHLLVLVVVVVVIVVARAQLAAAIGPKTTSELGSLLKTSC